MPSAIWLFSTMLLLPSADAADAAEPPLAAVFADVQDLIDGGPADGVSGSFSPARRVRGAPAQLAMATGYIGGTAPISATPVDAVFAGGSLRYMFVRTSTLLPTDHKPFPSQWWDPEIWAAYVRDIGGGQLVGIGFGVGSPSDRPFHGLAEMNFSAMVFLRKPAGPDADWLFFLGSSHAGQLGHYLPLPGFAYEFREEHWHGAIGLPSSRLSWCPNPWFEWENSFSLLTDIRSRLNVKPVESLRVFTGFAWENQSWFRAERRHEFDQFFYYQKKAETGIGWNLADRFRIEAIGGWAFDRYFAEGSGWSLSGHNRVNIVAGPFFALQAIVHY